MAAPIKIWLNTNDLVSEVTNWSTAVTDEKMNPHFRLAQQNLKLMIPAALYTALNTVAVAGYKSWTRTKTYASGNRVLWEDRLYSSDSSQSGNEPPDTDYWTEIEMWTVWRDYIKPHLIWQSAAYFAPYAEVRTAQEGIRRVITDYNEPLSREEQAAYQNNLQANADKYFLAFNKYMDDNTNSIDGTTYTGAGEDIVDFKTRPKIRMV